MDYHQEDSFALLREFAGQALTGLLANPNFNPNQQIDYDRIVKLSWSFATDMIARYQDDFES